MKNSTKLVAESCGSYPHGREFVHQYLEYPDGTIESLGISEARCERGGVNAVSKSAHRAFNVGSGARRPPVRAGAGLNARSRRAA